MRLRAWMWAAGALLAVVTVGACSASSGASKAGSSSAGGADAVGTGAGVPRSALNAAAGSASGAVHATTPAALTLASAKIRTAELTVAVRGSSHVAAKADEAEAITERAGGEVDADDRDGGTHASATLQLRVPPESLGATLTALSKLGTEKSRQLSTTDVTEKVADVSSRVASARQSITRLRTLYAHAAKVSDVISIESELNSREADLESLEAQQRALSRETAEATITLSLETAAVAKAAPAPARHRSGFVGGLQRGWDGFTATAAWVSDAVGTLLPFLVLAALVGVAGRLLVTRRRAGPTSPTTPNPTD